MFADSTAAGWVEIHLKMRNRQDVMFQLLSLKRTPLLQRQVVLIVFDNSKKQTELYLYQMKTVLTRNENVYSVLCLQYLPAPHCFQRNIRLYSNKVENRKSVQRYDS